MSLAASRVEPTRDLVALAHEATSAVEALIADATYKLRERVTSEGRPVGRLFDREQRAIHGLAWFATYLEAVRQLRPMPNECAMRAARRDGSLPIRIGLGEYLAQLTGGIPWAKEIGVLPTPGSPTSRSPRGCAVRRRLMRGIRLTIAPALPNSCATIGATIGDCGLDETLESIETRCASSPTAKPAACAEMAPHE